MTKYIDVSDNLPESYKIVFGGDTHCFVSGFAWDHAEKMKQYIKKKNVYWTCHGDLIDAMLPQDKRFRFPLGSESEDSRGRPKFARASDQRDAFLEYFDPIADKCLEVGIGNHEDRIINVCDIAGDVAKAWNIQVGMPMTVLKFGVFKAFLWHPFRLGMNLSAGDPQQRYTNECMRIRRAMRFKPGSIDCEVSIMSHIHKIRISPPQCRNQIMLGAEEGKFSAFSPEMVKVKDPKTGREYYPEDYRWFASTGALYGYYVDGDYTYAETMNYDPNEIGWIEAEVKKGEFKYLRKVCI